MSIFFTALHQSFGGRFLGNGPWKRSAMLLHGLFRNLKFIKITFWQKKSSSRCSASTWSRSGPLLPLHSATRSRIPRKQCRAGSGRVAPPWSRGIDWTASTTSSRSSPPANSWGREFDSAAARPSLELRLSLPFWPWNKKTTLAAKQQNTKAYFFSSIDFSGFGGRTFLGRSLNVPFSLAMTSLSHFE